MRLAFLADASLPHTRRWVNHFASLGHTCLLVSLEDGSGYDCDFVRLSVPLHKPRFLAYTLAIPKVQKILQEFQPNLINAHFLPNYGWIAVKAGCGPVVMTVLGSDILTVPHASWLHRWRTRFVLSKCAAVLSDAKMLTTAVGQFGFPLERIVTVPLGIELERFASVGEKPCDPLVILSTRRMEPIYDVELLVQAYKQLPREVQSKVHLKLAGSGSLQAGLQRLAKGLGIEFLGWLDTPTLDKHLHEAAIYVTTSKSDSTSVSLLEAMAAGCLPVASDIEGNQEWIRDGENGLLFQSGNAAALAKCLERAIQDGTLSRSCKKINRAMIAERAVWSQNMKQVEQLFKATHQGS